VRPPWAALHPGAVVDRVSMHVNGACILFLDDLEGLPFEVVGRAIEEDALACNIALTVGSQEDISFLVVFLYNDEAPALAA